MAISKKLLLISLFALNMHRSTQTHTNEVSNEISQILNFTQTLRSVNNKQALKVANWLEQQAYNPSYNVLDLDPSALLNVINNDNLTMQSKISTLSQTMMIKNIQNICIPIITIVAVVAYITAPLWRRNYKGGEPYPEGKSVFDRWFDKLKQNC